MIASVSFVLAILFLALGDLHRWQPEIQMFALFALAIALCRRGPHAASLALSLLRLYTITVYAYSGLQKLNPVFSHDTAPWLLHPVLMLFHAESFVAQHDLWTALAIGAALFEASLAVLLFMPATRRPGVVLAMLMHGFLLFSLGPLGNDWNAVIWPWNAFMLVAVPLLFWGVEARWLPLRRHRFIALAAVSFMLLPAGHAGGFIDAYPAHNLYSGYAPGALVCLPHDTAASAPADWRRFMLIGAHTVAGQPWDCVDELGWYLDRLHIPPYTAPRMQAALGVAACDELHPLAIVLLERDPPQLFRPDLKPDRSWSRTYTGCAAIRLHATSGLLGGLPR